MLPPLLAPSGSSEGGRGMQAEGPKCRDWDTRGCCMMGKVFAVRSLAQEHWGAVGTLDGMRWEAQGACAAHATRFAHF